MMLVALGMKVHIAQNVKVDTLFHHICASQLIEIVLILTMMGINALHVPMGEAPQDPNVYDNNININYILNFNIKKLFDKRKAENFLKFLFLR